MAVGSIKPLKRKSMAIDTEAARALLASARSGVRFNRCLTLGRQSYLPGHTETRNLIRDFGHEPAKFPKLFEPYQGHRYAEPFLEVLGANQPESLDASAFEGANIVHDLNLPLPEKWHGIYDAVYDGGTIEHVYNFQTAIRTCMELLKVGGNLFIHTPANNYFGHGFYQFSPELFFRILSPINGFEMVKLIAMEYGPRRRWFQVSDPVSIQARTPLINPFPVLLFVHARKTAAVPVLRECPQQSDYSAMWAASSATGTPHAPKADPAWIAGLKRGLVEKTPWLARWMEAFLFSQCNKQFSFRNNRAFTRMSKPKG